ncbi:hypothetical protein [Sagittula sp. MA-2]|jgi:hypothetical protein|uniref:hypothetical protein n=1 Tax=Sagittula sp. MA-2 TaxID=3048007 RepID=UPI0024C2B6E9|nr:hypothetical protein [Sagittula sp. MA-2]WHZ35773.1 hypothetical protein QNI11_01925 [Sagittula sp. MA-2]
MTEWKDATSYRRGEERNPRTWAVKSGVVRLVVMKDNVNNPGFWTMHAYGLGIEDYDIKLPSDQPAELAQRMAVNIAANKARELAKAISKIE